MELLFSIDKYDKPSSFGPCGLEVTVVEPTHLSHISPLIPTLYSSSFNPRFLPEIKNPWLTRKVLILKLHHYY
ncbi:MAG: hypothetical protein ACYDIA_07190 [Candidatus Humimicrobiaceae bacterium]